jgi:hypothetical protein
MQQGQTMDFITILNTIEELLFQIASWLVLFPITLFRVLRHPMAMADYVAAELADRRQAQFTETISPPLFFALCIFLSYALGSQMPAAAGESVDAVLLAGIETTEGKLTTKALIHAVWPIILATVVLAWRRETVTREALRRLFYVQCFLMAPFVLMVSGGSKVAPMMGLAPIHALVPAIVWFVFVQTKWLRKELLVSRNRAIQLMLVSLTVGLAFSSAFIVALGR